MWAATMSETDLASVRSGRKVSGDTSVTVRVCMLGDTM